MYRSHRFFFAVIVALLATSSLVVTSTAAPGPDGAGPLLQSKAERKAEAEARKAEAEIEKQRRKCIAREELPCVPVVTLSWALGPLDPAAEECVAVISVTGFAPGSYAAVAEDTGLAWDLPLVVGPDGTGSVITYFSTPISFGIMWYDVGSIYYFTVNGVTSAPSRADC